MTARLDQLHARALDLMSTDPGDELPNVCADHPQEHAQAWREIMRRDLAGATELHDVWAEIHDEAHRAGQPILAQAARLAAAFYGQRRQAAYQQWRNWQTKIDELARRAALEAPRRTMPALELVDAAWCCRVFYESEGRQHSPNCSQGARAKGPTGQAGRTWPYG